MKVLCSLLPSAQAVRVLQKERKIERKRDRKKEKERKKEKKQASNQINKKYNLDTKYLIQIKLYIYHTLRKSS